LRTTRIQESLTQLRLSGIPLAAVLDVGVQTGTPVLMDVFRDLTHHLFEPVDDYFPEIRKNYREVPHRLVHAAVSDTEGEVLLHSARKMNDGKISHSWITQQPTDSTRRVPAITLDAYLQREAVKGPFLLKVDVDGAAIPAAILRGGARALQECSAVVIEMTVDRFFERAALLDAAGFDLWDLSALCYYGDCLWQFDAVYLNRTYKQSLPSLKPMHAGPFRPELWQAG
jgi:FkbM family methyltransferase